MLDVENEHLFVVLGQFVKIVQLDGALGTGLLAKPKMQRRRSMVKL
jgi:hypothetical protein